MIWLDNRLVWKEKNNVFCLNWNWIAMSLVLIGFPSSWIISVNSPRFWSFLVLKSLRKSPYFRVKSPCVGAQIPAKTHHFPYSKIPKFWCIPATSASFSTPGPSLALPVSCARAPTCLDTFGRSLQKILAFRGFYHESWVVFNRFTTMKHSGWVIIPWIVGGIIIPFGMYNW